MAKYTEAFKREMVKKLLPPNSILASTLSREIGVGKSTLYKWRKKYVEGSVSSDPSVRLAPLKALIMPRSRNHVSSS